MKIKCLFIILGVMISCFTKAQQDFELYGFTKDYSLPQSPSVLARFNPVTGAIVSSTIWQSTIGGTIGTCTLDPKRKLVYDVVTDSWNMYLIRRDLNSGAFVDTVFTQDSVGTGGEPGWSSGEITGLFYNCYDEHVYFCYNKQNKNVEQSPVIGTRIARIDPVTGKVKLVTILYNYFFMRYQYCDPVQQTIYFSHLGGSNVINSYNIQTGSMSAVKLSRNYGASQYVTFILNANDNYLYGFEVTIMGQSKIIKINPRNGVVTDLSEPIDFFTFGNLTFNKAENKLYFIGRPDINSDGKMVSFDIDTKKLTYYSPPNAFSRYIFDIWAVQADHPDTTFTARNFCSYTATEFIPSTRYGSFQWDFGDPSSGILNTSDQSHASHVYTSPGTYEVTMTSISCSYTNVVKKKVTIHPFAKVDLGQDVEWCKGKANQELQLDLAVPGASYLWQDLSSKPSYIIKQPGHYWVKVTSSCGEVSDSLSVREISCPCPIVVAPTYATSSFTVMLDCEPSYLSNQLSIELFDMLGKRVLQKEITESKTAIPMEGYRSGVYFYQIRGNNEILNSGKIMLVDL